MTYIRSVLHIHVVLLYACMFGYTTEQRLL